MPDNYWVLLGLGALIAVMTVPLIRSPSRAMSILSVLVGVIQRWNAERLRRNEVRKRVSNAVTLSLSERETPEQLQRRLDSIGEPKNYLVQFGSVAFSAAMVVVRRDGRLSPDRKTLLETIMTSLQVSPEVVRTVGRDLYRYQVLDELDRGALPVVDVPGLVLLKDEVAHWSEPGSILEERVLHREYVGGSTGVSFRVAKGVYLRTGRFRGHLESQKGIVPISNGALVLTSRRMIFHGDNKSVDARWDKVLDIDYFNDGVRFSVSNRSKPTLIRFNNQENAEIVHKIIEQVVNQLRSGLAQR